MGAATCSIGRRRGLSSERARSRRRGGVLEGHASRSGRVGLRFGRRCVGCGQQGSRDPGGDGERLLHGSPECGARRPQRALPGCTGDRSGARARAGAYLRRRQVQRCRASCAPPGRDRRDRTLRRVADRPGHRRHDLSRHLRGIQGPRQGAPDAERGPAAARWRCSRISRRKASTSTRSPPRLLDEGVEKFIEAQGKLLASIEQSLRAAGRAEAAGVRPLAAGRARPAAWTRRSTNGATATRSPGCGLATPGSGPTATRRRWLGWLTRADGPAHALRTASARWSTTSARAASSRRCCSGWAARVSARRCSRSRSRLAEGLPRLRVLDSTDPQQIKTVEDELDLSKTLFFVSSKSGTTLEPNIFAAYFHARVTELLGAEEAGRRFIAITDPGTPLEQLAERSRLPRRLPRLAVDRRTLLGALGLRDDPRRRRRRRRPGAARPCRADGPRLRRLRARGRQPGSAARRDHRHLRDLRSGQADADRLGGNPRPRRVARAAARRIDGQARQGRRPGRPRAARCPRASTATIACSSTCASPPTTTPNRTRRSARSSVPASRSCGSCSTISTIWVVSSSAGSSRPRSPARSSASTRSTNPTSRTPRSPPASSPTPTTSRARCRSCTGSTTARGSG